MAERPQQIERLFDVRNVNNEGIYAVWININGMWEQVILDDFFPTTGREFAFSHSEQKELWVALIEKAYAKCYGNYKTISGGDPVLAMRDLSGAPFERVDELHKNTNAKWQKLLKAIKNGHPIACYTFVTDSHEEQHGEGMVGGHAYAVLDAREVVDSRGQRDNIIKLRNPWGMFEWKLDWGDTSDRWTPQLKRELNVTNQEDGIFWMPFSEFIKFAQGMSICYVMPEFKYNSTYVSQHEDNETSLIRLGIPRRGHYVISLDQMDSKFFKQDGYGYSFFRVLIGRMTKGGGFVFIDGKLSSERNIFFNIQDLQAGDYVVSVEAYWEGKIDKLKTFTLSCYGEHMSDVGLYNIDTKSIEAVEYYLWKSLTARNNLGLDFKKTGSYSVDGNSYSKKVCTDYGIAAQIYAFENNESGAQQAIYQEHRISNPRGMTTISQPGYDDVIMTRLNPGQTEVIVHKMNPNYDDFSVKQKINNEYLDDLIGDEENGIINSQNGSEVEQCGTNLKAVKQQIPQSYETEIMDKQDLKNVYSHGGFAKTNADQGGWQNRGRSVNYERDQMSLDNCSCTIF